MATLLYNNRPARAFNFVLNEMLRDSLPTATKPTESFVPAADVLETESGFELQVALPGVAKENVTINFQEGQLVVSGQRQVPAATEGGPKFRRSETGYGSFSRSFRLPDTVDATAIDAQLQDGILRVTLPLDVKKTSRHHIEVR